MKIYSRLLRIARLILLLNVIPFVRGCDDVRGIQETAGFPIPFFAYSTSLFNLTELAIFPLAVNIVVLTLLIGLMVFLRPQLEAVLLGWRFFLRVTALGVLLKLGNIVVFIVAMLLSMALGAIFDHDSPMPWEIDLFARALFLPLLWVGFLWAKRGLREDATTQQRDPS